VVRVDDGVFDNQAVVAHAMARCCAAIPRENIQVDATVCLEEAFRRQGQNPAHQMGRPKSSEFVSLMLDPLLDIGDCLPGVHYVSLRIGMKVRRIRAAPAPLSAGSEL
jgi:hypothetical protein